MMGGVKQVQAFPVGAIEAAEERMGLELATVRSKSGDGFFKAPQRFLQLDAGGRRQVGIDGVVLGYAPAKRVAKQASMK